MTRDGTAELISRDQILGRERGQEQIILPCSADHDQDWHIRYTPILLEGIRNGHELCRSSYILVILICVCF